MDINKLKPVTMYLLENAINDDNEDAFKQVKELVDELTVLNIKTGPWIAGGFVRRILDGSYVLKGDVDIFGTKEQLEEIIGKIDNTCYYICTKASSYGLKYIESESGIEINLITGMPVESVEELFEVNITDFRINRLATDLHYFVTGEGTLTDLSQKELVFPETANKDKYDKEEQWDLPTLMLRTGKFMAMGYTMSKEVKEEILRRIRIGE